MSVSVYYASVSSISIICVCVSVLAAHQMMSLTGDEEIEFLQRHLSCVKQCCYLYQLDFSYIAGHVMIPKLKCYL